VAYKQNENLKNEMKELSSSQIKHPTRRNHGSQ